MPSLNTPLAFAGFRATEVTREPYDGPQPPLKVFEPAKYSLEELRFFLLHLGKSPLIVLDADLPAGVNPVAVQSVLGRIYDLEELQKHRNRPWAGLQAVRDSISRFLLWTDKSDRIASRRVTDPKGERVRHASMFEWDGRKRPHKGGIDSDGNMVVSEILADGTRRPFRVDLLATTDDLFAGQLPDDFLGEMAAAAAPPKNFIIDDDKGVITCPICQSSQTWDVKKGRKDFTMTRGRMINHLRRATTDKDQHRVLFSLLNT